jgi:hypothetical protein
MSIEWKPIETAPEEAGDYLFGYDENSATAFGFPEAGLCIITWIDGDDGEDGEWQVMPFAEGLDCIGEHSLTHWAEIPKNLPKGARQ